MPTCDCDSLYFVLCTVGECLSTLERLEPQWRFLDRWMVKTGFCQRQFRQTNEHQRYLNKKLNSELHGKVEFIQTSLKILFSPSRNEISSLTLGSRGGMHGPFNNLLKPG